MEHAGDRPAHDRRRSDLLVAQISEDLAESLEPFFEQSVDGFKGGIPPRDPGAAVDDDGLAVCVLRTCLHQLPDSCRLVADGVMIAQRLLGRLACTSD